MNASCEAPYNFYCGSGECIPLKATCDGKSTCKDGSDEDSLYCLFRKCPSTHFTCKNNVCVEQANVCNNINDCGDNSDEEGMCEMKR